VFAAKLTNCSHRRRGDFSNKLRSFVVVVAIDGNDPKVDGLTFPPPWTSMWMLRNRAWEQRLAERYWFEFGWFELEEESCTKSEEWFVMIERFHRFRFRARESHGIVLWREVASCWGPYAWASDYPRFPRSK